MDPGKRLFQNAIFSSGRRPLVGLIGLFLTPFILHQLGQEVYGIWALTGSVLAYTGILYLGLNSALTYHVPKLLVTNDLGGINRVVSSVFVFRCATAVLTLAFGVLLVWKFPDWFNVPQELRTESRVVVALVATNLTLQMPLSVYMGVLDGFQRYDITSGMNVLFQVLRAVAIVVALGLGLGLIALAAVSVGAGFATTLSLVIWAYMLCPDLSVHPKHIDWASLPDLMSYSVNTAMYASGALIMLQSGKTLAGLLYGPGAVTVFAIPLALLMMVGQIVRQAARPAKPFVSTLDAEGRKDKISTLYLATTRFSLLAVLPATALFMLNGETILRAWVGGDFSAESAVLLSIMTLPHMLRAANSSGFFVLSGMGLHRLFGIVVLVQSAVSIVLGYLLAEPGGMGLVGVALGFSIPELIVSGLVIPLYCWRTLGLRLAEEWKSSVLPAMIAAAPFVSYCAAIRRWVTIETRLEFVLIFGLSAIPLALGIWFLGLTAPERDRLKELLPSRRGLSTTP